MRSRQLSGIARASFASPGSCEGSNTSGLRPVEVGERGQSSRYCSRSFFAASPVSNGQEAARPYRNPTEAPMRPVGLTEALLARCLRASGMGGSRVHWVQRPRGLLGVVSLALVGEWAWAAVAYIPVLPLAIGRRRSNSA